MKKILMNTSAAYPIYIDTAISASRYFTDYCKHLHKRLVIITDTHISDFLGKPLQQQLNHCGLDVDLIVCPAGEMYKTREMKQQLEDQLLAKSYGRDTCLIALGGGVISDLVGFLASTYCRGVPVIYMPTTLLAMVDASIGGKTGVNTPQGKNLIGTFTQPHAVFIDINTLITLPEREWRNGMAEMIKHGVIADAKVFHTLLTHAEKIKQRDPDFLIDMIYASCRIKKNIVEQDEHEQGLRQILNFGHTIGHAIETIENYHIGHGEAVAIGMLVEAYLSVQLGYLAESCLSVLEQSLREYGLPLQTIAFADKKRFNTLLTLDKKSINKQARFILLDAIGKTHGESAVLLDSTLLNLGLEWATMHFSVKHA